MSDGAFQGLRPTSALKVILGGEPEEEQVPLTPEQFAEWIRSAPSAQPAEDSYNEASRLMARCFIAIMEADPVTKWSISSRSGVDIFEFAHNANPDAAWAFEGCTGFMVGWAFNAARKVLSMQPVANPAIFTLNVEQ